MPRIEVQPTKRQRRFAGKLLPLYRVSVAGLKGSIGVDSSPTEPRLWAARFTALGGRLQSDPAAMAGLLDGLNRLGVFVGSSGKPIKPKATFF